MPDLPTLLVDANGTILRATPSAERLLGPCVGRLCCEVISLKDHEGGRICSAACAHVVAAGEERSASGRMANGDAARLVCQPMGDDAAISVLRLPGARGAVRPLTPREREVLSLIALGFTNSRIARRLGIGASTVRTHVEHLLEKLGGRSRAEAVARAIMLGEIDG